MRQARHKSSLSHPLSIDVVRPKTRGGAIGMSFCPGQHVRDALSGDNGFRDLETDLGAIQRWGATVVVTLLASRELTKLRVEGLGAAVNDFGIRWYWLEIKEGGIPEGDVARQWREIKADLSARLSRGEWVFMHGNDGLGRTGTLATERLVACGEAGVAAMQRVAPCTARGDRNACPGGRPPGHAAGGIGGN